MHNYMRYNPSDPSLNYTEQTLKNIIGYDPSAPTSSDFASAWGSIALKFVKIPNVIFELMNEPHDLGPDTISPQCGTYTLTQNYNAAIGAIRYVETANSGVNHLIILCGTSWSCMGGWLAPSPDNSTTPPRLAFPNSQWPFLIGDSGSNWALSVHQYLNVPGPSGPSGPYADLGCGSGSGPTPPTVNILTAVNFTAFVAYLKTNKLRAFLTETGAVEDAWTITSLQYLLRAVCENVYTPSSGDKTIALEGGFMGFTVWSAGNWGSGPSPPRYIMDLNPFNTNVTTADGEPTTLLVASSQFGLGIAPLLTRLP